MNFYFYDLETFGINPRTARIAQFAGIRTDEDFNILSQKMFYCQPTGDSLPDPEACLVTAITPQLCQDKGIPEYQFIQNILAEFNQGNTCVLGYNNICFDDEFVRYTAWRNLLEPYAWSYKNGNSRFDLLDVVRFCYALKKDDSLNWVYDEANKETPSFKLDKLAPANGIEHSQAHDALADVIATIEITKKIKQTQPQLWQYVFGLRDKKTVANHIKLFEPILHTSGMYPPQESCIKLVSPICYHPQFKDRVIIFNLEQNPKILLDLSSDDIKRLLYTKQDDLAENEERPQLKEIHFNKSPMFVKSKKPPTGLNINVDHCLKNLAWIEQNHQKILSNILPIYQINNFEKSTDVDQQLYDGFVQTKDRKQLDKINQLNTKQIKDYKSNFSDKRLAKLLFHYKARNFADILNNIEQEQWFDIIQSRIREGKSGYLSIEAYFKKIDILQAHYPEKSFLWQQLSQYGEQFS